MCRSGEVDDIVDSVLVPSPMMELIYLLDSFKWCLAIIASYSIYKHLTVALHAKYYVIVM